MSDPEADAPDAQAHFQLFDSTAPVSGHRPPAGPGGLQADAAEHEWSTASAQVYPILRPPGTEGITRTDLRDVELLAGLHGFADPLIDRGPLRLVTAFVLEATGFDIVVSPEHLASWGIPPDELAEAAHANLARWSKRQRWSLESSGDRRLVSSDSGGAYDASRILIPSVRAFLVRELTKGLPVGTRVLIGLPERRLLVAAAVLPGDDEYVGLFGGFMAEQSSAAEEPVDPGLFELRGDDLVEYAP